MSSWVITRIAQPDEDLITEIRSFEGDLRAPQKPPTRLAEKPRRDTVIVRSRPRIAIGTDRRTGNPSTGGITLREVALNAECRTDTARRIVDRSCLGCGDSYGRRGSEDRDGISRNTGNLLLSLRDAEGEDPGAVGRWRGQDEGAITPSLYEGGEHTQRRSRRVDIQGCSGAAAEEVSRRRLGDSDRRSTSPNNRHEPTGGMYRGHISVAAGKGQCTRTAADWETRQEWLDAEHLSAKNEGP